MKHRSAPRPASAALTALTARLQPASPLAEVQRVWVDAAGPALAAEATPTAARAGVVTVTCPNATWGHELALMAPVVVDRLNAALGAEVVRELRVGGVAGRGWGQQR